MNPALDGLNVLELGAGSMPASITGMLLADNGARVTKVEPPEGDRMRTLFPTGFLVWNRGKESLIADLRTTEGLGAVTEWARSADVVIEGLATGRLERWGLSLSALRTQCPSLVTCSISGFGPTLHLLKTQELRRRGCSEMRLLQSWRFWVQTGPDLRSARPR